MKCVSIFSIISLFIIGINAHPVEDSPKELDGIIGGDLPSAPVGGAIGACDFPSGDMPGFLRNFKSKTHSINSKTLPGNSKSNNLPDVEMPGCSKESKSKTLPSNSKILSGNNMSKTLPGGNMPGFPRGVPDIKMPGFPGGSPDVKMPGLPGGALSGSISINSKTLPGNSKSKTLPGGNMPDFPGGVPVGDMTGFPGNIPGGSMSGFQRGDAPSIPTTPISPPNGDEPKDNAPSTTLSSSNDGNNEDDE